MVKDKKSKNKFPLFKIVFESFSIFFNNFKSAIVMGGAFSVIFTVLKIFSGQSLFCYNDNFKGTFICLNNFLLHLK